MDGLDVKSGISCSGERFQRLMQQSQGQGAVGMNVDPRFMR